MPAPDGALLVSAGVAPTTCAICAAPLGPRFWMLDYPRAAHVGCIDWSARAFPFAWRIRGLEVVHRRVAGEARLVVARLLRVLTVAEQRWPHEPQRLLDGCGVETDRCRRRLVELGVERRELQRF